MNAHPVVDHPPEHDAPAPCSRILIVDDHPLIRQVVRETLEDQPGLAVCAEAADDLEARRLIAADPPNLALVDLSLGESYGIDLIKWIAANFPAVRILVLSMHDASLYAQRAIQAGAHGYVSKRDAPATIIDTIRKTLAPLAPLVPPP